MSHPCVMMVLQSLQCDAAALRPDLICLVRKMKSSSFFRPHALLHLCRLLLRPFITLLSTKSTSRFKTSLPPSCLSSHLNRPITPLFLSVRLVSNSFQPFPVISLSLHSSFHLLCICSSTCVPIRSVIPASLQITSISISIFFCMHRSPQASLSCTYCIYPHIMKWRPCGACDVCKMERLCWATCHNEVCDWKLTCSFRCWLSLMTCVPAE